MNTPNSLSKSLLLGCLALLALLPKEAQSASIIWQQPQRITGDSDVRTTGTLLGAYSFQTTGAGTTVATVNGVPFKGALANTTQVNLTNVGQYAFGGFEGGSGQPYASLSAGYRVLAANALIKGTSSTLSLTFNGLSANETYLVQFWVNNSAGTAGNTNLYSMQFNLGTAASPAVESMEVAASRGKVGQYIVGYLKTGPSDTTATFTVTSASAGAVFVNAVQIRTAPDRVAWLSDTKYGVFLNYNTSGSFIPATSPGGSSISAYIPPGETQSAWSKQIEKVCNNIPTIVSQIQASGAGYVIVTLGYKFGYYASPNSVYENAENLAVAPYQAHLIPGEFTSKRDLILELANALEPHGIKVFVYLAAEGPWDATATTRKYDNTVYTIQHLTYARAWGSVAAWSPAAHPAFRTRFNNMIKEWSSRWGSKVSGWWFDGCFLGGYAADGIDPDGNLIGSTNALANLNALIAAAKFGNPGAAVAVNEGADLFGILTANQDYMGGESAQHKSQYAKFHRYPTVPYISYGGSQVLWHSFSYLGNYWRTANQKYVNEELINYVSSVNKVGGVVTMDVAYDSNGIIDGKHLDQLKAVKAALKPAVAPKDTVTPLPASYVNLALFKPAFLKNNGGFNTLRPASGQYTAHAGVDGNFLTKAQAGDEYGWNYTVDLEGMKDFNRIVFYFTPPNYSTLYQILYSDNGLAGTAGNWQHFAGAPTNYTNSTSGLKVHDLPVGVMRNSRFIRIISLAPSASGQPGGSMALSEFEVYNTAAASTAKDVVWMDEEVPTGATLTTAGTGTWKWAGLLDGLDQTLEPSLPLYSTHGLPYPKHGMRVHWNTTSSGYNAHGFTASPARLILSSTGDSLYCWAYVISTEANPEILLRWKTSDTNNYEGRVRWGSDYIPDGGYDAGSMPSTGAWVKLTVPASNLGLNGKTLIGLSFETYNCKVVFDRAGKETL